MGVTQKTIEYIHRISPLAKMRTFWVTEDALLWCDDGGRAKRSDYSDIVSVTGKYIPSRIKLDLYQLSVNTKNHGIVEITNRTYSGLTDFRENNYSYVPFINALHRNIVDHNPSAEFKKGSTAVGYIASILSFTSFTVAALIAVYYFLSFNLIVVGFFALLILLISYPALARFAKYSKPAIYDPLNLPPDIVPPGA